MKCLRMLILSNVFIALAAVFLSIETQILLGLEAIVSPSVVMIFFATMFVYNLPRLIKLINNMNELLKGKDYWVVKHKYLYFVLTGISLTGIFLSIIHTNLFAFTALLPFIIITLFYSLPLTKKTAFLFSLREIPYLKIFLIAIVWSGVTVVVPAIESDLTCTVRDIILLITERFLFVFAITIPFDIRDMEADHKSGLKTIPLKIGEKNAEILSFLSLILYFIISVLHFGLQKQHLLITATVISFLITFISLRVKKLRKHPIYYYGILDGTMLIQGIVVLLTSTNI